MRFGQSLILCTAATAFVTVGCEVHEHVQSPAALQGEVVVAEPQGEVIDGPGVTVVDVEPDPSQRVYIYDEGYPPGTYVYNNYYYYGGYRYPHDIFVNRYVQENIREHRYVNVDQNRQAGQKIEQSQRAQFAKTHGVRQSTAARPDAQPRVQTPARAPEPVRPAVERPDNRAPGNDEHRTAVQQPANRPPANAEPRTAVERPASPAPAKQEQRPDVAHQENKAAPKESAKPNSEDAKHEEGR